MSPKIKLNFLVLQKVDLPSLPTAKNIAIISQFNKKVISNHNQLLYILIKPIKSQQLVILINRQHIFKNQSHCLCLRRIASLWKGDSFNMRQFIQPKLSRCDEMSFSEVGYFKRIVILADKSEMSLLDGNIAFIWFCF